MLPLFMLGALIFFLPVAAYCLFLAMLNSRQRPTMVAGPWDFAGVLFALSGFLLAGGPAVAILFSTGGRASVQGLPPGALMPGGRLGASALWLLYFAGVLGGAVYFLLQRQRATVVYNVDPAALDELLARSLDQLQLSWTRVANRIFIGPLGRPNSSLDPALHEAIHAGLHGSALEIVGADDGRDGAALPSELTGRRAGVELEPFPSMCNVVLHWRGDDATVRRDVEAELDRWLRETAAPDNPASGWFLTVSSCIFFLLLVGMIFLILFRIQK